MLGESDFPPHKAELILSHNEHKNGYRTVTEWDQYLKDFHHDDDIGWVSEEQRRKAIATDSVWILVWYPETPVGFNRLMACDLDVLLEYARGYEPAVGSP